MGNPVLHGYLIKAIPKQIKGIGVGFDMLVSTFLGKIPAPMIYGFLVDKYEKDNYSLVANSFAKDKRNPLQIAAFLNFSNIFLYLLTYDADSGKIDSFLQNTWHILAYRGHTRIMELLLNHIRYELIYISLYIVINQI